MIPTVDNAHVAEGQKLLTSRYATAPVCKGIVTALMLRMQEIETQFWAFLKAVQLTNHPMAGGPWDVLDKIGDIVGVLRNGLSDPDFLALIKLKARVNRSRGTAEDVLGIAALMTGVTPPFYLEMPPASFYLGCWNIALNYPIFVPLLAQARAASVYGLFTFSTWVDGNDFECSSRYDASTGQGVWGSRYDGAVGGLLVAAVAL